MIFNILDNTTELWMTKYKIGEIFNSGGATLYKSPSDQTVLQYAKVSKNIANANFFTPNKLSFILEVDCLLLDIRYCYTEERYYTYLILVYVSKYILLSTPYGGFMSKIHKVQVGSDIIIPPVQGWVRSKPNPRGFAQPEQCFA